MMCGIVGTIDTVEGRAEARVAMLNESQQHRGPDHSVLARVGCFTLGNTRLAIQDPGPAGNQPFVSSDGRYHCVFNGEIYNYRRLVEHYQLPVRTACDGEVIPHLWAKLGPASLAELRGMFAIAIVDSLEERLYLARDPFGIKPLYWRVLTDGPVVFASEIRPLVQRYARRTHQRRGHRPISAVSGQWRQISPHSTRSRPCRPTASPPSTGWSGDDPADPA